MGGGRYLYTKLKILSFSSIGAMEPTMKVSYNFNMKNPVKTPHVHPGVLEDRLVSVNTENDANLFKNVFKTYTESFVQL